MDDFEKKRIFKEKLRLMKDNTDLTYRLLDNETVTFEDAGKSNPDIRIMVAMNLLDVGRNDILYLPPYVRKYEEDLVKLASAAQQLNTEDFRHIRMLLREEAETDPENSNYIDSVIQRLDKTEEFLKV